MQYQINEVLGVVEGDVSVLATWDEFDVVVAWKGEHHGVVLDSAAIGNGQALQLSVFDFITQALRCCILLYRLCLGRYNLELCERVEDSLIQALHIKDAHLRPHA